MLDAFPDSVVSQQAAQGKQNAEPEHDVDSYRS